MTFPRCHISRSERELILTRLIDAPRSVVFAAWTTPELLAQWFAPAPWRVVRLSLEPRTGGRSEVVMQGPDGAEIICAATYLEVRENERIVFTDAYTRAWLPAIKPFSTVCLDFEKEGAQTRYTARVAHWTSDDREAHERMGFREGWTLATEQLATLAARLAAYDPIRL